MESHWRRGSQEHRPGLAKSRRSGHDHDATAFVMISTDKAVNPTSVMGSCKRLAEQYVQARSAGSTAGSSRCVLATCWIRLAASCRSFANRSPRRAGHDHPSEMTRYFMLIPEAAQLVIQAGAIGQGAKIFVLDMGDPVRIPRPGPRHDPALRSAGRRRHRGEDDRASPGRKTLRGAVR